MVFSGGPPVSLPLLSIQLGGGGGDLHFPVVDTTSVPLLVHQWQFRVLPDILEVSMYVFPGFSLVGLADLGGVGLRECVCPGLFSGSPACFLHEASGVLSLIGV